MEHIVMFSLLIITLIALIINVAFFLTIQEDDYQRRNADEEAEWQAVNAILQAYLDGVEKGLSLSKQADHALFNEIDDQNNETKNSCGN